MKHSPALTRNALCLAIVVLLAACSKKEESPVLAEERAQNMVAPAPAAAPVAADAAAGITSRKAMRSEPPPPPPHPETSVTQATVTQQLGSSTATYTDGERKFIRTANARFRVKDVYVAALGIEDTVGSHGGFVVKNDIGAQSVSLQRAPIGDHKLMEINEYTVQGHLIVRVPSAKTQEFLRAIVGYVVFLDQRNFSARDAQFALLRQQLDVQRNQETQTDLGQAVKDGGKLVQKTDAISARSDVKAARDAAHIAKKEFEDQVAFSTIELNLYQPSKVLQSERVDVSSMYRELRPGFFSRLGEQLRGGWEGLLGFVLALAAIWPVFLAVGLLAPVVWRLTRHQRKAPSA